MAKKEEPGKTHAGALDVPAPEANHPNTEAPAELRLLGQYIKDLSFESPHAPNLLESLGQKPQIQADVNVNATPQTEDTYEVTLSVEVRANSDAGIIYHVDLAYAGLFRIFNVPQALMQAVLFVDCPKILFPHLRRVLADVTRDGGFPPLMLDFGKLYCSAKGNV